MTSPDLPINCPLGNASKSRTDELIMRSILPSAQSIECRLCGAGIGAKYGNRMYSRAGIESLLQCGVQRANEHRANRIQQLIGGRRSSASSASVAEGVQ